MTAKRVVEEGGGPSQYTLPLFVQRCLRSDLEHSPLLAISVATNATQWMLSYGVPSQFLQQ
jgi:hypothetical protein